MLNLSYFTFDRPSMQQAVKIAIIIVFVIMCVSSYLYYYNKNSLLLDIYNYNSENTTTKLTYQSSQADILQDNYVPKAANGKPFTSKIDGAEHPNNQAQLSPDPVNVTNLPIISHTADKKSKGYILPYSIYEEQTNGANNLWQLQVWAKQVGMSVVEPFAIDSVFTMRGVIPNFNQATRFGDYFDKEEWDKRVVRAGGSPLVKWEEFVTNFPRDAIILHTLKRENENPPLTIAYDENATVCGVRRIARSDMLWIKETFNVIKTVCYLCATNFQHPLSLEKFNSLIFYDNGLKPNQVTLITVNWLGIRTARIHINPLTLFTSPLYKKFTFPPSKRVMTAYKAYVQQFIGDHKYVGIVFRTHHVMSYSPLKGSFADQSRYLLECSKDLSRVLDAVRAKWKIFLAYDMGMFGSKNYVKRNSLASLQEQIFLDVFNGSLQVNEREENLRKAANGTTDRGVIAQLEKVIATNGDCIILLGPHSTFVRSSSYMYISNHRTKKCIVSICAEKVYDVDHRKLISSDSIPNKFINN